MTTPQPSEPVDELDKYFLEHVEDVMMQLVIGIQKGKVLPDDVHTEAVDLFANIKRRERKQQIAILRQVLASPGMQPEPYHVYEASSNPDIAFGPGYRNKLRKELRTTIQTLITELEKQA